MKKAKLITIRIMLVEDDELFRLGLSTRLVREQDFKIVAEAEDGETAIEFIKTNIKIDIAILDIGLPGINGLETCQQMRLYRPELPILVLTSNSQSQSIEDLIAAHINGFCVKGQTSNSIVLAIRSIMTGASWWDNVASNEIFTAFQVRELLRKKQNSSLTRSPR
jgi:two-component system, NarL family, response regulator